MAEEVAGDVCGEGRGLARRPRMDLERVKRKRAWLKLAPQKEIVCTLPCPRRPLHAVPIADAPVIPTIIPPPRPAPHTTAAVCWASRR